MPTDPGAVAETDRYKADFRDGTLASFVNKLTGEEYLDQAATFSGGRELRASRHHRAMGCSTVTTRF